jgi:hypothetical protein
LVGVFESENKKKRKELNKSMVFTKYASHMVPKKQSSKQKKEKFFSWNGLDVVASSFVTIKAVKPIGPHSCPSTSRRYSS